MPSPASLKHMLEDRRIALPLLLLLTFAVYAQSIGFEFVYDDNSRIVTNELIRSPENIPSMVMQEDRSSAKSTGYYRPLIPVIDTLAYMAFGARPSGFHFLSITYHLIATALVYFLALRVLSSAAGALFAAAIFGLHPINTEAVAFVTAKNNVICGIFVLGASLCFMRFRQRGTKEGRYMLAASSILLFLGALSKEFALMTPFALFAFERISGRLRHRRDLLAYIPLVVVVAVYLALRALVLRDSQGAGFALETLHVRLYAMLDVLVSYLRLSFIPVSQRALYTFKLIPGPLTAVSAVFLAALVYASFSRRWRGVAGFPAAWFFLFLMPVMNILPVSGSPMAERSLYIPVIGAALFMGALYERHGSRRGASAVAMLVLASFAVLTLMRIPVWKDNDALYSHMIATESMHWKGWYSLGMIRFQQGDHKEARRLWDISESLIPEMRRMRYELGLKYEGQGQYEKAEAEFRKVLFAKETSEAYLHLGNVLMGQGRAAGAEQAFKKALKIDPSCTECMYNLRQAEKAISEGKGKN